MELSAKTYTGFELEDEIINFWETHQWHPYGDLDFLRHEWGQTPASWTPWVAVIVDRKKIRAIAVGKIQQLPLKLQFGYKVVKGPSLTTLIIHKSGFIGQWDEVVFQLLMAQLRNLMNTGTVDALLLRMIPLDSPLHGVARSQIPFFQRDHFPIIQDCWVLNQLDSFEAFLGARRTLKRNFRTYGNRLARAFPNRVQIKCYRNPDDLELLLRDSEEVGQKTWQRRLGEPSFLDPEERSKYKFHLNHGWCRGYVLYLDGIPAAYRHGIIYKDVFYVGSTGYDPFFRHLGPGTYLLLHVIKEFCGTQRARLLDFNVGNAEDKRQFCNLSHPVAHIYIFAPATSLLALNALRFMTQGTHQLTKSLLQRLGWYHAIRRQWRDSA